MIKFRNVDAGNFEDVIRLELKDNQKEFLESNLYSIAEARIFDYLEPKAIYEDDTLVGFMLYYFQPFGVVREMGSGEGVHEIRSDGKDYIYLKRIMIDKALQGKGLGRKARKESLDFFRKEYPSAAFVELMHYLDNDTGASLYESLGFQSTGETRRTLRPGTEIVDEELVRRYYY